MSEKIELLLQDKKIVIETGKIAKLASGAVTVQCEGTMVLVTAVSSKAAREGIDFFPLTVEYQERTYAAGRIPGGFFKREGRPSEKEVLTSRIIDRPVRPLFPEGMMNEVQIIAIVLSSDGKNDSDVLAMIGSSVALTISDIPFNGPTASVRVGMVDGKFVINPTFQEVDKSALEIVISGTREKVLMIESASNELDEKTILDALNFARPFMNDIIEAQVKFAAKCGKKKRDDITYFKVPDELMTNLKKEAGPKLNEILNLPLKQEREDTFNMLCKELVEKHSGAEDALYEAAHVKMALEHIEKDIVRDFSLLHGKRVDKRSFTAIRPIECNIGILPRTHGSGLFTRGQTQSLAVTTLGTAADEQTIDALEGEGQKNFMLHYNFPPFSVGETKPMRGPGRREIGHGALAEKALRPVMPSKDTFPYTVRVVSDILESNGSSSMASVCAGTLSLMDAGVPIKAPVAGIAMGLVIDGKKTEILTDIAGVEDHYGDMDFKVAGTRKGVTAVQLDVKNDGLDMHTIERTLQQAKDARMTILDKMEKVISAPKAELSEFAPRIVTLKISVDKIKDVIGPGGKIIKRIVAETGVTIDIEDDGTVQVASTDGIAMQKAIDIIKGITAEAEVGKIYKGRITRLMNFGAFCEILPGKEGLIHVSELADKFVKNVADEVKEGDEVTVKCIEIDGMGRVNLSRKAAMKEATPQ